MENIPLRVGLGGFMNIGQTCYLSSILQLLLNCESLLCFVNEESINNYIKYVNNSENCIFKSFVLMLNNIKIGTTVFYPTNFKNYINEKIPFLIDGSQKDAHEIFNIILDMMYEECVIKANIKIKNVNDKIIKYNELKKLLHRTPENKKHNIISEMNTLISENIESFKKYNGFKYIEKIYNNKYNPFSESIFTFIIYKIECNNCNRTSYNFVHEPMIQIDIKSTLYDGFDDYVNQQPTDYKCENCKSNNVSKTCAIYRNPPILFIHLKRFERNGYNYEKNNEIVNIPDTLNIQKYCDSSIRNDNFNYYNYKLCGFINHHGSINGGHYTADCCNFFDNNWYHYDDDSISMHRNNNNINKNNAYILQYKIIN